MTQAEFAQCPRNLCEAGRPLTLKRGAPGNSIGFGPRVVRGLSQAVESDDNSEVVALQDQTPQENGLTG